MLLIIDQTIYVFIVEIKFKQFFFFKFSTLYFLFQLYIYKHLHYSLA